MILSVDIHFPLKRLIEYIPINIITGGPQPPTTSTMFSGASSSGNLWGKPSSPSFGSSFLTEQQQSFKSASNPQANDSSSQFASFSSSSFAPSHPQQQHQQQPRPFHPSIAPPAASAPFGVAPAAPVNNLFGSASAFDVSSASAFGAAPQQQQQHYQQNLFASSLHSGPQAPSAPHGAANPFLNGGGGSATGIFSPAASGVVRHPDAGNFPFAANNGQQPPMPMTGSSVVPGMGRVAGNPFL